MGSEPMKKPVICVISVVFLIFSFVLSCNAQKKAESSVDTKALFDKKCSACHSAKRATDQKKTRADWTDTVMRMKNKNGAPVNDEEAKAITEYLAINYGK